MSAPAVAGKALGLAAAIALGAAPGRAGAQTPVTPPAPVAALGAAADAIARADYGRALAELGDARQPPAAEARARLLALTGRHAEAERAARSAGAHVALGEMLAARGELDAAGAAFRAGLASGDSIRALVGLGGISERAGRTDEAPALNRRALSAYPAASGDAAALAAVAEAARRLGRAQPDLFHDAVRVLEEAAATLPADPEPEIRLASLFLDKYDSREADGTLRAILADAPTHPGALLLLARVRRFDGSAEAEDLARKALELDGDAAPARAFLALLRLEVADFDGAREEAGRALRRDPLSAEALGVLAAADLLEGDAEGPSRRIAALPAGSADAATVLVVAARLASRHHRYRSAADLAGSALEVDARSWEAHGERGLNLLRLGAVPEARAALETAFEGDPFNVWFKNTLDLLDTYDRYETLPSAHFALFLRRDEGELLGPYVGAIAEEAYGRLSDLYGHRPRTPVRLEVYPEHGDFSVRTVGLPGFGALGVSFGNVLAMNSPSAREKGSFNWASTLWHEVAHAVTLGVTDNRVPRWLTEGISVREERRARAGWGRRLSPAFVAAYKSDRMPPVSRLNEGFVRPSFPGQVGMSYLMASLVVEWIEDTRGFDALKRMLAGYGRGWSEERVFRDVLGATPERIDADFDRHLRTTYASRFDAVGDGEEPGAFARSLAAGAQALAAGRLDSARRELERAARLFPEAGGSAGPHALLARLHRRAGEAEAEAAALESWTAVDEVAYDGLLRLAELRAAEGDPAPAVDALERALWIFPFEPDVHEALAGLYERAGNPSGAVRERRAVLALAPADAAGAWYRLAATLARSGDAGGAREAVLRALEIAPRYEQALDLLLELQG